ncbi:hypothetical protein [Natronococcus occultus]|uniref:Uncharacterized protein n=1 Tax=Natronococcus occultus SP4 TaxID=694430 RepID=L0JYJ7_9EURY|nr:hypothetical protein [Natronococcus occultus]AGB37811.1 hypothetical protein Natoc_2025 [Natronococcus occultus SP4]
MVSAETLEDAITTYNEYRSPMATATAVDSTADSFEVRFEGPFCRMCCDYDYFEDLRYELAEYGVAVDAIEIVDIGYRGDETFFVEFADRS